MTCKKIGHDNMCNHSSSHLGSHLNTFKRLTYELNVIHHEIRTSSLDQINALLVIKSSYKPNL